MDRAKRLGDEKILKLVISFSIPTIIGLLVSALYNFVDRIFIGNSVGVLGIAGVTIVLPIMLIMMACSLLVGIGATTLVAINLGQQKVQEAEKVLGNAVLLFIILALLITVIGLLFLNPLLRIFGASSVVLPYARDYASIILLGALFQLFSLGLNTLIRASGSPQTAMFTMLIGAVLNAVLAPILIFGLHWGMRGAAIATVTAQAVSAIWVVAHFLSKKSLLHLHLHNLGLQSSIVVKLLAIGLAPFATQIVESTFTIIMNNSLSQYGGDIAVSSMGAVQSIYIILLIPLFGLSQGIQPIIGFNYGAKRPDRIRETLLVAVLIASIIAIVGFALTRLFAAEIISVFSRDANLIHTGTYIMSIIMLFLPILGFQVVGSSYFQAIGRPRQAIFLSLSRHLLFLIPALLILPHFYQLFGVLVSVPLADLLATIVTGMFLFMSIRKLTKQRQDVLMPSSINQ